nr:hypothetical protein [Tanacetum cinerariifolium]
MENKSDNYIGRTNGDSTNQEDRNEVMTEPPKLADKENKSPEKTYASATKNSSYFETNKLLFVPTEINETGKEVVIFDEDLVVLGSKKWESTLCGQLISHSMSLPALNYHLRRMWHMYGFKEIVDNGNVNWLFKFTNEQGMSYVVNQSPWMVNGRPLMVQKWDISVGIKTIEPKKVPVWIKLLDIHMEAWTTKGISDISSSVEIDAGKGFKEVVKLQYRDKQNQVKRTKTVKVAYDWKTDVCSHCVVFGHDHKNCKVRTRTEYDIASEKAEAEKTKNKENGFVQSKVRNFPMNYHQNRNNKEDNIDKNFPVLNSKKNKMNDNNKKGKQLGKNSFNVLRDLDDDNIQGISMMKDKMIVDKYLNMRMQPSFNVTKEWSYEMVNYFKRSWEVDREKEKDISFDAMKGIVKDVFNDV